MKQSGFDELPKAIAVEKHNTTAYFQPIIFKFENDGHSNAYFAMYAKYNPRSHTFDVSKALFWAKGASCDEAVSGLLEKYSELKKFIKGRSWVGEPPASINLLGE